LGKISRPCFSGTDVKSLEVFAPKKIGEKIGVFLFKILRVFARIGSEHRFLRKTPFFAENRHKIAKM
jgi:hypothetical protein